MSARVAPASTACRPSVQVTAMGVSCAGAAAATRNSSQPRGTH